MRVLVTGGAGFIGSTIVDSLAERGDTVVAIDDLSTGSRTNVATTSPLRVADVSDERQLRSALRGETFDAIVHAASKTKVVESMEKPDLYRRVIVNGTRNIATVAGELGVRMLVNLSTGGAIYGETADCASEDTAVEPLSNYGKFKAEAEQIVSASRVPSITLRLANVYGPRQRQDLEGGVIAIFLGKWLSGEPLVVFGGGTAQRDYVFVSDVVDAVLASLSGTWKGMYNIGTGVATSVNDLIKELSAILGQPQKVIHTAARPSEIERSCVDASKAERDGLWRPRTSLRDGLRSTARR
jgi:UDP-glucose 4-epimerase